jgi:hypothetical protein
LKSRARKWLDASHDCLAPDLLFPEAANALWKKVRQGEVSADDAASLVHALAAPVSSRSRCGRSSPTRTGEMSPPGSRPTSDRFEDFARDHAR